MSGESPLVMLNWKWVGKKVEDYEGQVEGGEKCWFADSTLNQSAQLDGADGDDEGDKNHDNVCRSGDNDGSMVLNEATTSD